MFKKLLITLSILLQVNTNAQDGNDFFSIAAQGENGYKLIHEESLFLRAFEKALSLPENTFKKVGIAINSQDNLPFLYFMEDDVTRWAFKLENMNDKLGITTVDATCIGKNCTGCCLSAQSPVCTPCANIGIGTCERRSVGLIRTYLEELLN